MLGKLAARLSLIEERGLDTGPKTTKRLRALLDELRAINDAVYTEVQTTLTDQLTGQLTPFASRTAVDAHTDP